MEIRPPNQSISTAIWKVLIIDDDEDDFIIVQEMLKEAKGRVIEAHWAATYEAGQIALAGSAYDAVLVDYDLGVRKGTELIREANEQGYASPLILFTGHGGYEIDLEAMQAGATFYLTKDEANPLLLERSIRYAIEIKQKEAALIKTSQALQDSHQRTADITEHHRADQATLETEAALRLNEARLREFLENTHDTYFSLDRQWRFTYANHKFGELFNIDPQDVIGKNFWELYPQYLGTDVEQYYRKVMAEGAPVQFQRQGVYTLSQYELSLYPTREGLACFAIDRTKELQHQQQLEAEQTRLDETVKTLSATTEALRRSEEKFARAFRSSPIAIAISTVADGRYVEVSESYTTLLGYSQAELIGHTSLELGLLSDPRARQEIIRQFRAGGGFRNYETQLRTKAGDQRDVLFSTEPLEIDHQDCMLSMVIDITERKRAEQSLRDAHNYAAWMARFPEENPNPVVRVSAAGMVLYRNPPARDLAGWNCEVGQPVPDPFLSLVSQAMAKSEEALADIQLAERFYSISVMPFSEEGYANLYGRDITQRKQAEEALAQTAIQLERSNQELEQFAFVASHDLQEPLRKIKLFSSSIQQKLKGKLEGETQDHFDRMINATERMQAMIEDLLALSRVNMQGRPFVQVDLDALVTEVVSDLEPLILRTGGRVRIEELPSIEADPIQIHQLLQNLIGNALKFHKSDTPPVVKVTSTILEAPDQKAGTVSIQVKDNGIGFEEAQFEKILQPFQRLHGRVEFEGNGIGLAIVKRIVDRHHGIIYAQSTPGEGSTFTIHLPIKQA